MGVDDLGHDANPYDVPPFSLSDFHDEGIFMPDSTLNWFEYKGVLYSYDVSNGTETKDAVYFKDSGLLVIKRGNNIPQGELEAAVRAVPEQGPWGVTLSLNGETYPAVVFLDLQRLPAKQLLELLPQGKL
ncbi:MAG: hypothetical protein ABIH34_02410 [Nanoarchaeota archaeon]